LIQKMPKSVSRAIPTKNQAREDIDWSNTSAWLSSPGGQGIIINPDKEKKDYDQIKESLSKTLGEVVSQDDGPVLKAALPRGKVYWGPHVDSGPDIVLALSDGWRVSESMAKPIMEKSDEGWHHRDGIFIGNGSFSKNGDLSSKALIWDITPTIMDLLDIPVPHYMDGHSLVDY